MKIHKLVAAIALRNRGSRLYGKPMQNLDVESSTCILDNVIGCLRTEHCIDEIVLGIAEGNDAQVFIDYAQSNNLNFIIGDETDVLSRLVLCGDKVDATDIFRVTSESPFPSYEMIDEVWKHHCNTNSDATFYDDVVDGCGFEIIKLDALRKSHILGNERHRSEHCTLFIRENIKDFGVFKYPAQQHLIRQDLRLTVDNAEDLILCKAVFQQFEDIAPRIPLKKIINFLDQNSKLVELTEPFTEKGYETMYRWVE